MRLREVSSCIRHCAGRGGPQRRDSRRKASCLGALWDLACFDALGWPPGGQEPLRSAAGFASPWACSGRFCRRLRGPSCGLRISAPCGRAVVLICIERPPVPSGRRYGYASRRADHRGRGSAPPFGRGEAPACRGDRGPWARPLEAARRDGVVQRLLQTEPAQEDPLPGVGGEHAAPAPFRAMPRN